MNRFPQYDHPVAQLTPREHIRVRPGMYIGGTDSRGLHHLAYEILDHMAEEAFVGRCDHIWIELRNNREISIRDNSEGIPVDQYKATKLTKLEALIQEVGAFKSEFEPDIYHITGGLHGVGLSVVNILSAQFKVENRRDGFLWTQTYRQGIPEAPLSKISLENATDTGTTFTFTPDYSILEDNDFDLGKLEQRAQALSYQTANLTVTISDLRVTPNYQSAFHYPDGLKTRIVELNSGKQVFHEPVHIRKNVLISTEGKPDFTVGIEIAFQFSDSDESHIYGYSNTVETPAGGTYLAALKAALLSCFNGHLENYRRLDNVALFTWDEIAHGLSAVVAIRHPHPSFVSPTKVQLANAEIYGPVSGLVFSAFSYVSHWQTLDRIIKHHLSKRSSAK